MPRASQEQSFQMVCICKTRIIDATSCVRALGGTFGSEVVLA